MWEGLDQVSGRMKKFGDHIQKLNAKKEDQNIGGDMGVFYGGDDRSIGHNLYFWTVQNLYRGVMIPLFQ